MPPSSSEWGVVRYYGCFFADSFHPLVCVHSEGYTLVMPGGRVAILMVDIRGSRSFYHEDGAQHYFGSKQWTFIKVSLHMVRRIHTARALSHSLFARRGVIGCTGFAC